MATRFPTRRNTICGYGRYMVTRRAELEELGFVGFVPFADLPTAKVPQVHGVYVVLRIAETSPIFRATSTAGWFQDNDPSVDEAVLRDAWVAGEEIIYIGKAGGKPPRGLRKRLDEYRRYGSGKPVGHRGGRYVWQLQDSAELIVAWRATPNDDPGDLETRMLDEFRDRTGSLPFANLQRGRIRR